MLPSEDTLWLKMLGDKESARKAFGEIEQLSPARREKNDIIKTSLKYCVYLKGLPVGSLTEEEQEFMKTMADVDAWYEAEMNRAKVEGALEGEQRQQQTIAIKMLRENISVETIARITELSLEQIQQLRANL
jgi:predicted transposase YdaD